jgi:DNA helicase IV
LANFLRLTAYLALLSSSERTIKKSIALFQTEMLEALAQPNWRQHNAQQISPLTPSKKATLGVIRVYDAKGHEFNTVLLPPIWQEAWVTPEQRYVAASRAKSLLVISKATQ